VFINNYKYALRVSDALCVHHQEHYKLKQQPLVFVMSWDGINPVYMSRSVSTVLFHGQNVTAVTFWPWNSTVLTYLDIYTGFIPTHLMTNTSGCCYIL